MNVDDILDFAITRMWSSLITFMTRDVDRPIWERKASPSAVHWRWVEEP